MHRDLKPANVDREDERYFQRPRTGDRLDAKLERGELRHDEGEDRRGRWGMRHG